MVNFKIGIPNILRSILKLNLFIVNKILQINHSLANFILHKLTPTELSIRFIWNFYYYCNFLLLILIDSYIQYVIVALFER